MRSLPVVVLLGSLCAAKVAWPAPKLVHEQDPVLQEALAERAAAASEVRDEVERLREVGRVPPEYTAELERRLLWSRRAAMAAAEAGVVPLREALGKHLAKAEQLLAIDRELFESHQRTAIDLALLRYEVADTKVQLARAGK